MNDTAYQDDKPTNQRQVKSKKRVADFGEVFTGEREVNAMLDLLPPEIWHKITATFLEPACGTGNFLVEILSRKLAIIMPILKSNKIKKSSQQYNYEFYAIQAISSIYGIEIQKDNCQECRERLLGIFTDHYQRQFNFPNQKIINIAQYLLEHNIVCGDALFSTPILFSEWAFVGEMVYRTDYIYQNLINDKDYRTKYQLHKKYNPVHYLKLSEQ
ncbi:restriction endonuclease subunit M [Moraxella boevrei]|uniref:restriction endonuclease subunit M n=1 Tax=Faucicola boevrei TaxID=346665 RepID=UPI0037369202